MRLLHHGTRDGSTTERGKNIRSVLYFTNLNPYSGPHTRENSVFSRRANIYKINTAALEQTKKEIWPQQVGGAPADGYLTQLATTFTFTYPHPEDWTYESDNFD